MVSAMKSSLTTVMNDKEVGERYVVMPPSAYHAELIHLL